MQRIVLLLILTALLVPISGQASFSPKLFVETATDKRVYKQGEPMGMALTVLNQNSKARQVQFSSAKIYDFHLYNEAEEPVWKWSGDKMFAMALVDLKLEQKKPLTYVVAFNQILPSGKALEPGKYRLVGEFCVKGKPYRSKPVEIEVR